MFGMQIVRSILFTRDLILRFSANIENSRFRWDSRRVCFDGENERTSRHDRRIREYIANNGNGITYPS